MSAQRTVWNHHHADHFRGWATDEGFVGANEPCAGGYFLPAIPRAMYYVTCVDGFMSGWGRCQTGEGEALVSRIVLLCESGNEATRVADHVKRNRAEAKYVKVTGTVPRVRRGEVWCVMTRETSSAWFPELD